MMPAIPVPIIRRKRIIKKFLKCGATSAETAVTAAEANVFKGLGFMFARLEKRGILKSCGNNKYYVDTTKY